MGKELLSVLTGQYRWAADFYDKYITVCPENVWSGVLGRFPVWQNVYHALACVPFFLGPKEGPQPPALYPLEVLLLRDVTQPPADKGNVAAYAQEINALAGNFLASLNNEDLAKPHEGFSSRMGRQKTNLDALTGVIGHHMYHFGICDAALRASGQEGLF